MAASVQTRTPRIFVSYSHKDQKVKERLVTHLNVPQADVWDDSRIKPGDEWLSEIEQAMAGADVAILLISADFLTSRFVLSKEVPVLLERREREGLLVYPVLVEDCAWDQVEWLAKMQIRMWEGKPLPGGRERNTALAGIARDIAERFKEHTERPPEPRMSTAKLPSVSPLLFGREKELALLDEAWADPNTNIVSLVAFGGVGKTALVSKWLNQKRCWGADCVFGWSFYSQGAAEDRQTSAEPFIEKALEWFGDPDPKQGSAWEKGAPGGVDRASPHAAHPGRPRTAPASAWPHDGPAQGAFASEPAADPGLAESGPVHSQHPAGGGGSRRVRGHDHAQPEA
jgi:hypothetical protein